MKVLLLGAGGQLGRALRRTAPAISRRIPAGELLADLWMQSPPDIFRGTEAHGRRFHDNQSSEALLCGQELL